VLPRTTCIASPVRRSCTAGTAVAAVTARLMASTTGCGVPERTITMCQV
jgi:hypothetical protein